MKIGVISDTHIPVRAKKIPEKVFEIFEAVDLILHAGDIVNKNTIDDLGFIAKVEAVKGNMDDSRCPYPVKKVLTVEKLIIGLMHGYGPREGVRERIREEFDVVDIIVYGHSHRPYNKIEDGVLFFNPGTPTDKVSAIYNSVGILEINEKDVKGEIFEI